MDLHRFISIRARAAITAVAFVCVGCGGGGGSSAAPLLGVAALVSAPAAATTTAPAGAKAAATPSASPLGVATSSPLPVASSPSGASAALVRHGFLGAFFRPQGSSPFGVFQASLPANPPAPYPTTGATLTGASGYCDQVASNGFSIESGYVVDPTKLADITSLGVGWTRTPAPQFFDDGSHIFGAGHYSFGDFDSAQCSSLADHRIRPVINLEAGPVEYNASPGVFSPQSYATYQSAGDFGQWCGVVAAHELSAFPSVSRFTLPGNEVNSNPTLFPGGLAQIATYSQACYAAIKTANPAAFVYGFELNMDGSLNAPAFVRQMTALGCKVGTCYDGLAIHLSLQYPVPAPGTPCYPNAGGEYGMQCITDIENAAGPSVHVLVSETVYPVPAAVPDEATKALAVVAEFSAYAANPTIDGVSYANVDECAFYPSGYFSGGCLINTSGQALPAFTALQQLAVQRFQ